MAHHTGRLTVPEEVRTAWGECRWARVIAYAVVSRHAPSRSRTHCPGRGESRLRQVPMGKGDKPMRLSAGMAHHAAGLTVPEEVKAACYAVDCTVSLDCNSGWVGSGRNGRWLQLVR